MTGSTRYPSIVITGIIGGGMPVDKRRPTIGRVAHVTIQRSSKMTGSFTGCRAAVTGLAITGNALVIPGTPGKRRRGMAEMAVQRCWNVVR